MAADGQQSKNETPQTPNNIFKTDTSKFIDIGAEFNRWIELKNQLQCGHETLARMLLDVWNDVEDEEHSSARVDTEHSASSMPYNNSSHNYTIDLDKMKFISQIEESEIGNATLLYHNNKTMNSRRKPLKSQVSRYLEDFENLSDKCDIETDGDSKDYDSGSSTVMIDWAQEESIDENSVDQNIISNEDMSSDEINEVENIDTMKKKKDSDSDWVPSEDSISPHKRKRSKRIMKRGERKSVVYSTEEYDSEMEEFIEQFSCSADGNKSKMLKPKLTVECDMFHCSMCDTEFSDVEHGEKHLKSHYTVGCDLCSRTFYSASSLAAHREHSHMVSHNCNNCMFSTKSRPALKRHIRHAHKKHVAVPVSTLCHVCGEQFRYGTQVYRHMAEVHGIKESSMKKYICDQCGNEYFMRPSLRKHMLSHQEKTITCEFEGCVIKFSNKFQYKRHFEIVHLKIKKHACPHDDCGMKFANKMTLLNHVNMVHLKVRLFPCTWQGCDRSFYAKKHLTVHLRIHNDEKPFACDHCDYRCRQRAALNWHLKKHGILPEHPDSVANEIKNNKNGFPVNFKRGRKRTRHKKSRGVGYSHAEVVTMNQNLRSTVLETEKELTKADIQIPQCQVDTPVVVDEMLKENPDTVTSPNNIFAPSSEAEKSVTKTELIKSSVLSIPSSFLSPHQFTSHTKHLPETEMNHFEVMSSTPNSYSAKTPGPEKEFPPACTTNHQCAPHTANYHNNCQPNRELNFNLTGFPISRNMYSTDKRGMFPTVRNSGDYSQMQDIRFDYQGYPMKENLNTTPVFPRLIHPRNPFKDSYQPGSRDLPQTDPPVLRGVPQTFQRQVAPQYDSQLGIGVNTGVFGQGLTAYPREYK